MTMPSLAHRIPGHPIHYYLKASGGYWLYQQTDTTSVFVAVFATRRDLDQFMRGIH